MLPFFRSTALPSLGASISGRVLLHPTAWVCLVRSTGLIVDKRLYGSFRPVKPRGRCLVQIVLSGRMRLTRDGEERWLGPGDVSLQDASIGDERWEGDPFEAIVVEWSPGAFGDVANGWSTGRVSPRELAQLGAWARAIDDPVAAPRRGPVELSTAAAELAVLLHAAGLPIRRVDARELVHPSAAVLQPIARLLSDALSRLSEQPALVDIERGADREARHVRRLIAELGESHGFPPDWGWRRMLYDWRLHAGAGLMSAAGARGETVAASLGYRSAQAFHLAMARAGLPSPGSIAQRVRALA